MEYRISCFLPAYNEVENLERVVRDARAALLDLTAEFEVIVVDDGSTDGTRELADSLSRRDPCVRVVHHDRNRGYGGAVLSSIRACRLDHVFFTDGDGQFSVSDLRLLLPLLTRVAILSLAPDSGRALWNGNSPYMLSHDSTESIDRSEATAWRELPQADGIFTDLGIRQVRRDPPAARRRRSVMLGALSSRESSPGPVSSGKRYPHLLPHGPVLVPPLPGLALRTRGRRDYLLGFGGILAAAALSAILWGQTRFRVPTDWFLFIPAAFTLRVLWAWRVGKPG